METTNASTLRTNAKKILEDISKNDEMYLVQRKANNPVVIMSFAKYNSLQDEIKTLSLET